MIATAAQRLWLLAKGGKGDDVTVPRSLLVDISEQADLEAARPTCRDKSRCDGWMLCLRCGAFTRCTDLCGDMPASYCGNCGAEVVRGE